MRFSPVRIFSSETLLRSRAGNANPRPLLPRNMRRARQRKAGRFGVRTATESTISSGWRQKVRRKVCKLSDDIRGILLPLHSLFDRHPFLVQRLSLLRPSNSHSASLKPSQQLSNRGQLRGHKLAPHPDSNPHCRSALRRDRHSGRLRARTPGLLDC